METGSPSTFYKDFIESVIQSVGTPSFTDSISVPESEDNSTVVVILKDLSFNYKKFSLTITYDAVRENYIVHIQQNVVILSMRYPHRNSQAFKSTDELYVKLYDFLVSSKFSNILNKNKE